MAVSFKVPASPKRDIFNIDNFLGVDLTNTGANIEEVRSPNAENMVRYVPGKVRKRTGYQKDVIFGTKTNVNFAADTSAKEQEFKINDSDIDQYIDLYPLIMELKVEDAPINIYFEFDYTSEYPFWIEDIVEVPASEEWTHFSYTYVKTAGRLYRAIQAKSSYAQSINIKEFAVMLGKDENYKWSPAPNFFVERADNAPIYGVHVGKTGTFEGNRVVNVNRALLTSRTAVSYSVTNSWSTIYNLAELAPAGRKFYVEFDYTLTGDNVLVAVGGDSKLVAQSATETHFSGVCSQIQGGGASVQLKCEAGNSATMEIRNFSVMYEVNHGTYRWSAAPEDDGGVFPIGDTFLTGSKNYAIATSFDDSGTASGGTYSKWFQITDDDSHVADFCHIAFDIHTASYNSLITVKLCLIDNQNLVRDILLSSEHLNSQHFDLYLGTNGGQDYFKYIAVDYTVETGGTCWTYISNIQVNEISERSSYDISPKWYIYHVGSDLYLRASNSSDFTKVYDNANKHLSKSWQFNKTLYILDGENIYSYAIGDETVRPINEENGYIPTLTIAKEPQGGGVSYEPLNMLQPGFIELFEGKANVVLYNLSFGNLDATPIKVWVLNSLGGWDELIEGTDFRVNRGIGQVIFTTAPGVSPITGEDNVKIQAYRTVPGYRDRITKCTNGTLFGVGGAEDRLFLTGNPDYPNWDFYSEQYDPTYFPDTGYSALGSEQSAIVGYAIVNNYLAAFKDGFDTSQTVFIREGDLVVKQTKIGDATYETSEPAFRLINTLQGNGVVAPYSFGYLQNEPLFLTKSGVYAITAQDITGEKYAQNRSFYLDGKLTKENGLENAVATVFNDMYVLAVNNQLYILDGLQATRTDRSEPYATRQYVGFHCTNVPAVCVWNDNDALWFGTNDGKVCQFYTDVEDLKSYNDDGKAIYCCWETPDLDGKLFYKNKTFRYFAIRMMKSIRTSVKLWGQKRGNWSFIKEDRVSGLAFDFENIDFELFSFSTDRSEKVAHAKVRVKKVDKARFRAENGMLNEPFGLFDLALEYIERGNYKG